MGETGRADGQVTRRERRRSDGHRAFPALLTHCFLSLPSRGGTTDPGNSQVLLDAPIQLSKITERTTVRERED